MNVYLVRSLLLSFFIAVFITSSYYMLREEIKDGAWIKFNTPPKTYSVDLIVTASRMPFTQDPKAFKDAVKKNVQVIAERFRAAGIKVKMQEKNDSSYIVSVKSIKDTNSVRELVAGNLRLTFYEVYNLQDLMVPLTKDTTRELFTYLAPVQPYQASNGGPLYPPYIGVCKLEDSGRVRSYFSKPENLAHFPADIQFLFGKPERVSPSAPVDICLYAIRKNTDALTNRYISMAEPTYENGSPIVNFRFNAAGSMKWERMTERNVGKSIAMVINDVVIMAPTVVQKITGGHSRIDMSGSYEYSRAISVLLNSEELVLPCRITGVRVTADKRFPAESLSPFMNYLLAFVASFAISFCIIWFIFRPGKNNR